MAGERSRPSAFDHHRERKAACKLGCYSESFLDDEETMMMMTRQSTSLPDRFLKTVELKSEKPRDIDEGFGSSADLENNAAPTTQRLERIPESPVTTGNRAKASLVKELANSWPPPRTPEADSRDFNPQEYAMAGHTIHDTGHVKPLTKTLKAAFTKRNLATSRNESARAKEFSISKLIPVLTAEMERFSNAYPDFSYQFGWKGDLTVFVSDLKKDVIYNLKSDLEQLLRQHIPAELVNVKVELRLPNTVLCCGGIGTTLNVDSVTQLVGLYLQYDGKGTVFWVSSAHGLISGPKEGQRKPTAGQSMAFDTSKIIRSQFSPCLNLGDVFLVAQYVSVYFNGVVISNDQEIVHQCSTDNATAIALQKPLLCHSVDIMIGPTPLTNWHLRDPTASYARQLKSAVDRCGYPPLCSITDHRGTGTFYEITGIRRFTTVHHKNIVTFDIGDLTESRLVSYLGRNRQLAEGTVSKSIGNRFIITAAEQSQVLQNMIVIQPINDCCKPEQGHSGSVWVQQRDDKWEAVAITCAVTEDQGNRVWLASPLCACLLALSEEYPRIFNEYSRFNVLQ